MDAIYMLHYFNKSKHIILDVIIRIVVRIIYNFRKNVYNPYNFKSKLNLKSEEKIEEKIYYIR